MLLEFIHLTCYYIGIISLQNIFCSESVHMKTFIKISGSIVMMILVVSLIIGCGQTIKLTPEELAAINNTEELHAGSLAAFEIPIPTAPGTLTEGNDTVVIDYSNTHEGYVIAKYTGTSEQSLKIAVTSPQEDQYFYTFRNCGSLEVIPLAEGPGTYKICVYQNIGGVNYERILSFDVDVDFDDDHAPFLRPSQFVNYGRDSHLVALAYHLTKDAGNTDEKISAIYEFVVNNFVYDYNLAATVPSGYLPNLDEVLNNKKGICFDYAALVTAMLRSQGIPTMLEIGYHGDEYHAWISVLCHDVGWIENRYHHNGEDWSMLDPTVESGARRANVTRQEARDDDEYSVMFNY